MRTRIGWSRVIVGSFVAAAVAAAAGGGPGALAVLAVGAAAVAAGGAAAVRGEATMLLPRVMLLALAARTVVASALHLVLVARGTGGALFYDDAGYVLLSTELARSWRAIEMSQTGQALATDPSFANGYINLAAALFWLVGESVLSLKILNTTLGVLQAALVYRTMRNVGLPGARAAALLTLVFPSTVLWAALALKDTYAVTFMLLAIWGATEFQRRGSRWAWATTVVGMLALRDVRVYVFTILALAWPPGLFLGTRGRRRLSSAAALVISAALLLTTSSTNVLLTPGIFSWTAYVRSVMGQDARSAYVEPPPLVQVRSGERFRVEVPGRTPDPDVAPALHEIPAGVQLVVLGEPVPPLPGGAARPIVRVRAGDVLVVVAEGPPRSRPADRDDLGAPAAVLRVGADRINTVAALGEVPGGRGSDTLSVEQGILANLRHLPYGLLFLASAPNPLAASTPTEQALIPEMLLWYAMLALAGVGLGLLIWRRDTRFAFGLITCSGIVLALSLAEGNVGTLVRHRAMVIPFVVILGCHGAVFLADRAAGRWPQLARVMTKAQLRATHRS